jgi:glycosyltransferase involved in cell wall biosynthesis
MSSEPRIFHLITRLIDGGAVTALVPIATDVEGFDVTVGYGSEVDEHHVETLQEAGIETKQFPLMRHYNPVTALGAIFTVARYINQQDFDIVHTHSTEAGIIGRVAARIADVPQVAHTIHGVPFAEDRNDALNWFVEKCERTVAPWTDEMVSIADVITEEYLERGIGETEQYRTIPYGIELEPFRNALPAEGLPGDGIRVLMVSRLAKGKGFDVLLDAVERLDTGDFSVLIVGDGSLRERIAKDIEARGLDDTVFMLGYRDDVPSVMAGSDMLVLPSYREGTPLVIIEAMASSLPVVATNVAGIPEQIENETNGFVVEPGDSKALTRAIERLLSSSELRERFGTNGRCRADKFAIERMVSDYESMYRELSSRGE